MTAKIIPDMDIVEYHDPKYGLSSSGVKLILDCPKRFHYEYYEKPKIDIKEINDKFKIGRAVHMLSLEPEKFEANFFCMTNPVKLNTNEGKEEYRKAQFMAAGREILRAGEWEYSVAMAESVKKHSIWKHFLDSKIEHSIFWEGGIFETPLKARPDIFSDKYVIDLKTTDSIDGFNRSVYNYGYHRQAAMQVDALKMLDGKDRHFAFFVVEKKAPYLTSIFTLDAPALDFGRTQYLEAASIYSECMQTGKWPGYVEEAQIISLPNWTQKEETLNDY